jgi:hypothetical protein
MVDIKVVTPKTKPIFAILDPKTLLIAKADEPDKAAFILTINSGADVAKDTTVKPITILEIFNLTDKSIEERTRKSPPTTNKTKPKIILKKSITHHFYANVIIEILIKHKT